MQTTLHKKGTDSSLIRLVSLLKECNVITRVSIELAERSMQTSLDKSSKLEEILIRTVVDHLVRIPTLSTGSVWFGGPTKCKTGSGIRNSWANAILIGCSLIQDKTADALNALSDLYTSPAEFAYCMASQDDRLISSILALFLLKDHLSSKLNHRLVCGHVFAAIEFNYETIIDWLNSEALCIRFFMVFLEDLEAYTDVWKETLLEVQRQREDAETMSFMPGTWIEIDQETVADVEKNLEFTFMELAGTRFVQKKMKISKTEPTRSFIPYTVQMSEETYFSRLYDMLVRLRLRLEAIGDKNLGNYRAIVKMIEKYEELVDEEEEMNSE